MSVKLDNLTTETTNTSSENIDIMSPLDIVTTINNEDKKVALAVEKALPEIAKASEEMAKRFLDGGRFIYIGAGTSGRLGVLDAVELIPTYNVTDQEAFGLIAGGEKAMYRAVEGAEDSEAFAIEDLKRVHLSNKDVVIAIAASGRTPYAISAINYANEVGALSVSVTNNSQSEMSKIAKIAISAEVGPEVVSGSTRMKSGTAQKMILNMLSTSAMIQAGRVYKNYMVHVQATNLKLVERSIGIIQKASGCTREEAEELFEKSDHKVAVAIVMYEADVDANRATELLSQARQNLRRAIELA